jgi:VIT1/CCC1 family predicted Fe2+/Mn2+ transporter
VPSRRRRRARPPSQAAQPTVQSEASGLSLGWKWRTFPTFAAFAAGGLIPSALFYFSEPVGLSFVLYAFWLFMTVYAVTKYTFRWTRARHSQTRRQHNA